MRSPSLTTRTARPGPALGDAAVAALRARLATLDHRRAVVAGVGLLAAVAALATAGFGGPARTGPLAWAGEIRVFGHPTLPGDRVLTGTLRNAGVRALRVDVGKVRLVAADGSTVPSAPVFLKAFGRRLWAAGLVPAPPTDSELQRTGRIALLSPGEELPLTIAWRAADGTPVRVHYGEGSLAVPG